jgi:hypothetical protein
MIRRADIQSESVDAGSLGGFDLVGPFLARLMARKANLNSGPMVNGVMDSMGGKVSKRRVPYSEQTLCDWRRTSPPVAPGRCFGHDNPCPRRARQVDVRIAEPSSSQFLELLSTMLLAAVVTGNSGYLSCLSKVPQAPLP